MIPVNQWVVSVLQILPRSVVKPFALRYIAGETMEDAIRVVKVLNGHQVMGTMDILGEHVSRREESLAAVRACEQALLAIHENRLNSNLSIKLTQFGLKIDEAFCYSNVTNLLDVAKRYGNFVRIDMEDASMTDATLTLYERLRAAGVEHAGVVIQAYLRRSEEDLRRLIPMKVNVRLCKGAYVEPEAIAFKEREEIRRNFLTLLKMLFDAKSYVAIATHDEYLIHQACDLIWEGHVQKEDYEFQMLYGVKVSLREKLVADGHRLRVYVPFGKEWYAYSMRRFKENPQMLRYVLGSLFSRRG